MTDKLIELHFHCLPGLDDGPLTWDEAVALCRAAAKDGSTMIVATPHVLRYPWVNDDPAARDQRILKLNTLLGGKPKVLAGCEYLFSSDALELWDRGTAGPLTGLNRTDYLLTEFPWGIEVQQVSRFLYEFSLPGVTLVIAQALVVSYCHAAADTAQYRGELIVLEVDVCLPAHKCEDRGDVRLGLLLLVLKAGVGEQIRQERAHLLKVHDVVNRSGRKGQGHRGVAGGSGVLDDNHAP